MDKGKPCWCSALIGVIVIVFAWWQPSFAPYVLTVAGAAIVLRELSGLCCCKGKTDDGGSRCCK